LGGALIDDGAAGVTVQLGASVAADYRCDVHVDRVGGAHTLEVVVVVNIKTISL